VVGESSRKKKKKKKLSIGEKQGSVGGLAPIATSFPVPAKKKKKKQQQHSPGSRQNRANQRKENSTRENKQKQRLPRHTAFLPTPMACSSGVVTRKGT
jgi:hypothetical protein